MLGRTSLSTGARPFIPQVDVSQRYSSSYQVSDASQLPAPTFTCMPMPVKLAAIAQANSQTMAAVPEVQLEARGRTLTKEDYNLHFACPLRLPSRTPSPSMESECSSRLSGVPVAAGLSMAESLFTQGSPLAGGLCSSARGRTFTKQDHNLHFACTLRTPLRTPSPSMESGRSSSRSEVTVATGMSATERLFTQESSLTGTEAICEPSDPFRYRDFVVKNTFLHFSIAKDTMKTACGAAKLTKSASAPSNLISYTCQAYSMVELHEMGKCSPCAYLHGKADGCRQGEQCRFCHMCERGQLKQRKQIRIKAMKERRSALKAKRAERAEQAEQAKLADVDQSALSM